MGSKEILDTTENQNTYENLETDNWEGHNTDNHNEINTILNNSSNKLDNLEDNAIYNLCDTVLDKLDKCIIINSSIDGSQYNNTSIITEYLDKNEDRLLLQNLSVVQDVSDSFSYQRDTEVGLMPSKSTDDPDFQPPPEIENSESDDSEKDDRENAIVANFHITADREEPQNDKKKEFPKKRKRKAEESGWERSKIKNIGFVVKLMKVINEIKRES